MCVCMCVCVFYWGKMAGDCATKRGSGASRSARVSTALTNAHECDGAMAAPMPMQPTQDSKSEPVAAGPEWA